MTDFPDTTYTLSPEEYGTYKVGDKVNLGGVTFEVESIVHTNKVKLLWRPTRWQRLKQWLKVKYTWPTWIWVRIMLEFMPNHVWYPKRKEMTQIDWHLKATPLTKEMSLLLWVAHICMVVLLYTAVSNY
jgi:hypothetical protein